MMQQIENIKRLNIRQLLTQILSFGMVVTSAVMLWKTLCSLGYTDSPIVVVLSGSMEPHFYRGDILFLWYSPNAEIQIGDIIVYDSGREIPIVHRIVHKHAQTVSAKKVSKFELVDGAPSNRTKLSYLTKGDNNPTDDRVMYMNRMRYLKHDHLSGVIKGQIPYAGYITIMFNDFPTIKWIFIGSLLFYILASREKD